MTEFAPNRPLIPRGPLAIGIGAALVLVLGLLAGFLMGRGGGTDEVRSTQTQAATSILPAPAPQPLPLPLPAPAVPPKVMAPPVKAVTPVPETDDRAPVATVPEKVKAKPSAAKAHPKHPVKAHAAPEAKEAAKPEDSPAPRGHWVVQLGAFESDDHAKMLIDTLAVHGQKARVETRTSTTSGKTWFYVRTPPFPTRAAAQAAARRLSAQEHVQGYVLRAGGK